MKNVIAEQSGDFQKELAALARMVTFARQTAQDLNVSFPTYFLDMALASILDELKIAGVDVSAVPRTVEVMHIKGYH
jgi:tRNA A-37 threonylcarbamoyl transferase component Bud32